MEQNSAELEAEIDSRAKISGDYFLFK